MRGRVTPTVVRYLLRESPANNLYSLGGKKMAAAVKYPIAAVKTQGGCPTPASGPSFLSLTLIRLLLLRAF